MEPRVIIDDIEYDLLNKDPMTFADAKSLCKDG